MATAQTFASVRQAGKDRAVEAAVQRCNQLAMLPAVATQIIRLCEDPDATMDDLNRVIAHDPALGVRILKLVNSAYYGMSGQVSSVKRAVMLLGLQAVKNIAIAASLVKMFRGGLICEDFSASDLWTHSIAVANGARLIAQRGASVSPDEAFLAGLIHDIGILVEMQVSGSNFAQMLEQVSADETLSFRGAEQLVLGASHEELGAGVCQAWRFPLRLQLVTGFHHRPWDVVETDAYLPTVVHIADVLAAQLTLGYRRTVETDVLDPGLIEIIGLAEEDLAAVAAELPQATRNSELLMSDGP